MSELSRKQRGYLAILVFVFLTSTVMRFGHISYDGYQYLALVNTFLGTETISAVNAPFAFRILPAFLTALLSWIAPPQVIWPILSLTAGCLWVFFFYKLIAEFCKNETVVFLTTLVMLLHPLVYEYTAMMMVDTFEMMIITGLMLAIKRGYYSDTTIYMAVFAGMFVKETVLLVLVFYFLYNRQLQTVAAGLGCGMGMCLFRLGLKGSIFQTLSFTEAAFEERLFYNFVQIANTIGLFTILLVFGLILTRQPWWSTEQSALYRWIGYSLLTFIPLAIVAFCFAWFHARFLWPLYLAFGPGLAYAFSAMIEGDEIDAC